MAVVKEAIKMKIRKGDQVKVISGRDRGKTGRVLEVDRERNRLLVEGVMLIKRHTRANPQKQIKGGIAEKEATIHASNVMVLTSDGKPTKVGYKIEGQGASAQKTRFARKTGELLSGGK